ncbi:MAG: molybdate ABC transporter substrate-binding protein [Candidatus Eremiobacteraeota bacterium]|nr:molybdate ABC transporter substrate-binding protein [Candidatus Eremiobacteraeota bacterium]MBV8645266.1 molybdate ABC transporter substrate-binding protein [Candidatus Eremiobacteraeota bacterium]
MNRVHLIRAGAALAAALALTAGPLAAADKPVVTVFAAASLREAFDAAAPAFTKATGYPVRFSYGGSDTLVAQLLQGAPADVFASANEAQMKRALDASAVVAPRDFARNQLVVIVPANDTAVTTIADLGKSGTKVVLAAPTVPVGTYARQAFATLAKDATYGTDFATRVQANVVSEETDVKAVATKISLGEGDAGVVYATDVTPSIASKVKVLHFPSGSAPEATYPIAVTKSAPNADGARAFVTFITSPQGLAFLKARGFEE